MTEELQATTPKARWYIVHTYSGFEQRVEQTLREMMRTGQDKGQIQEVVMPTEKVIELVKGEKKTSTRKFYPGYVMLKMVLTDPIPGIWSSPSPGSGRVSWAASPAPRRCATARPKRS